MESKIVGRRISRIKSTGKLTSQSLRDYYENRNKILILREIGGLGDILMHRMMFQDFKEIHKDFKIIFACPAIYHDSVSDHPFIDEVVDSAKVNPFEYPIAFNTTSACGKHELMVAPLSDLHRSDIWAKHCGIKLKNHSMHFNLSEQEISFGHNTLNKMSRTRKVAICPVSAMIMKDLNRTQIEGLFRGIENLGFFPFGLHKTPIKELSSLSFSMISGLKIREWLGVLNASDYVISVDTSSFHASGGLGKPMVGIFSFADGKTYGRYYKNWELVQRHRDNGDWDCGPCYNWTLCKKCLGVPKPCITDINSEEIITAFKKLLEREKNACENKIESCGND